MSLHPYRGLPRDQFWSSAVATGPADDLNPVRPPKFTFSPADPVAAAGSCFAQHIARHLKQSGFNYLQTEAPVSASEPVFSARFGNIYTTRQLSQLIRSAYGMHRPASHAWRRPDGRFIDPLRPQLFPDGFASAAEVAVARDVHLAAVRRVFEECRIFVFTLGLTEAWLAPDGTALPIPPGVLAAEDPSGEPAFHNFSVAEMRADLERFVADLAAVNPDCRVILTVSPVPLAATYEARHILLSNTYSKAALRVVADETAAAHDHVAYFPSYEIIAAPQSRCAYFEADLRGVNAAGVAHVMRVFTAHMMSGHAPTGAAPAPASAPEPTAAEMASYEALTEIICDEALLDAPQAA